MYSGLFGGASQTRTSHQLAHVARSPAWGYGLATCRVTSPDTGQLLAKPARCAQDTAVVTPVQPEEVRGFSSVAGSPEPLGPSPTADGVNFALFSANATAVSLCLFDKDNNPLRELPMEQTGAASSGDVYSDFPPYFCLHGFGLRSAAWSLCHVMAQLS